MYMFYPGHAKATLPGFLMCQKSCVRSLFYRPAGKLAPLRHVEMRALDLVNRMPAVTRSILTLDIFARYCCPPFLGGRICACTSEAYLDASLQSCLLHALACMLTRAEQAF